MNLVEIGAIAVGGLLGLGAVITALFAVGKAAGTLWAFLAKTVKTVDIITAIPARLDRLDSRIATAEQTIAAHIEVADRKASLLDSLDQRVGAIDELTRDVHHEVKHNSGSSMKDALARVEAGVQGLYSPAGTGPVTVIAPTIHPVKEPS